MSGALVKAATLILYATLLLGLQHDGFLPATTYFSIATRKPLTDSLIQKVSVAASEFGLERVPDRAAEASGLLLLRVKGGGKSKRIGDLVSKLKSFQSIPVKQSEAGLEVVLPRYLVHLERTASEEDLARLLREAKFSIAAEPNEYYRWFVVSRSLKSELIRKEIEQLSALKGVVRVSPESFLISIP